MKENLYVLKHKNDSVGYLSIDEIQGTVLAYKELNPEYAPYLGNADLEKIKLWWQTRAIPGSRQMLDSILREAGCNTNYDYLAKNLGLSLTDSYWICPVESSLKWEDVCLFGRKIAKDSKIPYHNATSYDPNASLGGQMEKYWDLSKNNPLLVKTASAYYGQQAINEEFATVVHSMQKTNFMYVNYYTQNRGIDNAVQCVCPIFTSPQIEFVPALEIIDSEKLRSDVSEYDHFTNVCIKHGLDGENVRRFLDYQTMTDFLISNSDEHLLNFGILRAVSDLKFISPAPIFDSGNSMFYDEMRQMPYTRVELLERKITAIHKTEDKMLSTIKYKDVVKMDCIPSVQDVKEYYYGKGIPENKADFISKNYDTKAVMLNEFIQGKTISLFNEKQVSKK